MAPLPARALPARAARLPTTAGPAALRTGLRLAPGLRVGLFGGSFDPPHAGHLHVAEEARRRLGLDRVVFLVTPGNPFKPAGGPASARARLQAVRRLATRPWAVVSDIESRIGSRYTIDSVRWLNARHGGVRFVLIMGADSLGGLHRWKGWRELAHELPIAVVSRPGAAVKSRLSPFARVFARYRLPDMAAGALALTAPPAWVYLPAPFRDISSTALRAAALKI